LPPNTVPIKLTGHSTSTKAYLALIVTSLIWGTTWLVSKEGVQVMPALQLAGIRQLIGGSIFILFFMWGKMPLPTAQDFKWILLLAVLNFVLANGLSTWGVKYISSGLGCLIGAVYPLWLVLWRIWGERQSPPRMSIVGLLMGFAGIMIIFYDNLGDFFKADFRFGIVLSLLSTWSWAAGTLITKDKAKTFNPYVSLGYQMFIAGILLLIISSFDPSFKSISEIPNVSWFSIFYLVIFGSIIAFACFLYTLQHMPTEQASIYAYINPIIALIVGWWLGGEPLTSLIIAGAIVTIGGVYLVNRGYKTKA
jgi:drug/metabolite transporter (DMT)-like permease